ncbi:MAG TPA: AtpZ/AtpI family protein [Pseudomonadota bacterium]|jgi:ATP synthase protein I|nr:AtpZ/AtpI family protein [Pseudomonadota bacterium]HND09083.1 AtpZ/AtpI family protein [Pseudomonadota bacterium]HNF96163.1 AtpZ/AtpI family protein [Pseudomonadota bacterium]HNI58761.1 AtpZ/AtpI family protein [Pseudomonadota bacterium]HNK45123.1 AtpZ/AtpI family protein [Pseudomonadota bacterium]
MSQGATQKPGSKPDALPDSAQRLHARREKHDREQHGLISTAVTMVGLGWLVVIPGLFGIYIGKWLDGKVGQGVTFAAGLGLLGVCVGCLLAWQRISANRPK